MRNFLSSVLLTLVSWYWWLVDSSKVLGTKLHGVQIDASIRKTVLSCLDSRFDHHLAQAENLRSLFIALNDEVFEIRELAITTIGRLTIRNPAYVMPSLRKTLIQLLTELGKRISSVILRLTSPAN